MDLLDKIKNDLEVIFINDQKRLNHIKGVNKLAVQLAQNLGADIYKCSLAALLHDILKNHTYEEQLSYLTIEEKEKIQAKVLTHAYAASNYAKKMYNILENDVIIAVRSHVYGNMNMSLIDKILLVSDFCEENRTYEYCIKTREILLGGNFEEAFKMTLKLTIQSLLDRNISPTEEQLEIYRKYGN